MTQCLLSARGFSKSFYGRLVLRDVDLDVMAGEVHALLGQNGSGKSTLIKCLSGFHAPEPGAELMVGGLQVPLPLDPARPRVLGLAFVHQQLGLAGDLSVLDNLRVGRFVTARGWRIRWRENERQVGIALARVGLAHVQPHALVSSLTEVERAMLAIARALQEIEESDARVLVLDEPTAYLPRDGVEQLFDSISSLTASGAGVVFVTHRLDEVERIADRVTVLRDGSRIATAKVKEMDERRLVELIVGRPMSALYPVSGEAREDVVLAADNASGRDVAGFSIRLHRGETVGVTGLVGMGQEKIPYLLFGADEHASGHIEIEGDALDLRTLRPDEAIRRGVGLLPADRLRHGGAGAASARENITLTTIREYFTRAWIDGARERSSVLELMSRLDVRPSDPEHLYAELSGGNQQKVVLAKWLASRSRILLMHEPTQGVDVGARQEVFRHIRAFTEEGGAVLISSTEYEDLAHLCDRVVVFRDGRAVAELSGDRLSAQSIVEQAFISSDEGRTHYAAGEGGTR